MAREATGRHWSARNGRQARQTRLEALDERQLGKKHMFLSRWAAERRADEMISFASI